MHAGMKIDIPKASRSSKPLYVHVDTGRVALVALPNEDRAPHTIRCNVRVVRAGLRDGPERLTVRRQVLDIGATGILRWRRSDIRASSSVRDDLGQEKRRSRPDGRTGIPCEGSVRKNPDRTDSRGITPDDDYSSRTVRYDGSERLSAGSDMNRKIDGVIRPRSVAVSRQKRRGQQDGCNDCAPNRHARVLSSEDRVRGLASEAAIGVMGF